MLPALTQREYSFRLEVTRFDWGSDRYKRTGSLLPEGGVAQTSIRTSNGSAYSARLVVSVLLPSPKPSEPHGVYHRTTRGIHVLPLYTAPARVACAEPGRSRWKRDGACQLGGAGA